MRVASSCLIVVFALSSAACLRTTEFRCATSGECGAGGTCESVGFCSFPDGACASGERFSESAGSYANQCVGGEQTGDAGPSDGPLPGDAMIDAPIATGCPGGYNAIAGGQGTHLYRLAGVPAGGTANWPTQRDFCASTSTSAYLAVPDDATELAALATLAASSTFWIGLTDSATEDTWLTVKGAPAPFLNFANGQPDDSNPGEDCLAADATEMQDERCSNTQLRAVCECEP